MLHGYPKEWEKKATLRNGQQVIVRPETSSDTEMLWEMFSSLSDATLDNYVLPFTRERIERWTSNIDYNKNLTILSLVKEEGKHRIIGSASLSLNSFEALNTRLS